MLKAHLKPFIFEKRSSAIYFLMVFVFMISFSINFCICSSNYPPYYFYSSYFHFYIDLRFLNIYIRIPCRTYVLWLIRTIISCSLSSTCCLFHIFMYLVFSSFIIKSIWLELPLLCSLAWLLVVLLFLLLMLCCLHLYRFVYALYVFTI